MNTIDRITAALTPGGPFNRGGLVFRSVTTLAQFANVSEEEVVEILNGDLSQLVTCRPSAKGKGVLVALTANIPEPEEVDPNPPVQILAGNAVQAEAASPLPDAAPDQPAEALGAAAAEPPPAPHESEGELPEGEDIPF